MASDAIEGAHGIYAHWFYGGATLSVGYSGVEFAVVIDLVGCGLVSAAGRCLPCKDEVIGDEVAWLGHEVG